MILLKILRLNVTIRYVAWGSIELFGKLPSYHADLIGPIKLSCKPHGFRHWLSSFDSSYRRHFLSSQLIYHVMIICSIHDLFHTVRYNLFGFAVGVQFRWSRHSVWGYWRIAYFIKIISLADHMYLEQLIGWPLFDFHHWGWHSNRRILAYRFFQIRCHISFHRFVVIYIRFDFRYRRFPTDCMPSHWFNDWFD